MRIRSRLKKRGRRSGAAVVETAFTVPLVLLLTIGTLDVVDGIYLKKKAKIAAYEGARVAVGPSGTPTRVKQAVADYLVSRGVDFENIDEVVSISEVPATVSQLDPITVVVEIDLASNGRLPISVFRRVQGPKLISEVTMLREGGQE